MAWAKKRRANAGGEQIAIIAADIHLLRARRLQEALITAQCDIQLYKRWDAFGLPLLLLRSRGQDATPRATASRHVGSTVAEHVAYACHCGSSAGHAGRS